MLTMIASNLSMHSRCPAVPLNPAGDTRPIYQEQMWRSLTRIHTYKCFNAFTRGAPSGILPVKGPLPTPSLSNTSSKCSQSCGVQREISSGKQTSNFCVALLLCNPSKKPMNQLLYRRSIWFSPLSTRQAKLNLHHTTPGLG